MLLHKLPREEKPWMNREQLKRMWSLFLLMVAYVVGMDFIGCTIPTLLMLGITIILPMTFNMDKFTAICLLCGIWIGSASGSFIGSILLGIPGTPSSIATVYDGYEFTKPISGAPRYTFGSYYLAGGFSLVAVMTGIFAGRTILLEYARGKKGAESNVKVSRFRFPGRDLLANLKTITVSFFIGLWIGFLPGMGGSLSNVMAYAIAKNMSRYPEEFGTGCIDGVIAPEVANNASVGGAVIPFVALGIPGDATTAVLLGALTIQGVSAGPLIFRNDPLTVYSIFAAPMVGAVFLVLLQAAPACRFPAWAAAPPMPTTRAAALPRGRTTDRPNSTGRAHGEALCRCRLRAA